MSKDSQGSTHSNSNIDWQLQKRLRQFKYQFSWAFQHLLPPHQIDPNLPWLHLCLKLQDEDKQVNKFHDRDKEVQKENNERIVGRILKEDILITQLLGHVNPKRQIELNPVWSLKKLYYSSHANAS